MCVCVSTSGFMWFLGPQAEEPSALPRAHFMLPTSPQGSGPLTGGSSHPPAAQTMVGSYVLRLPVSRGFQTLFTVFVWKDSNYTLSVWAPVLPAYPPSGPFATAWRRLAVGWPLGRENPAFLKPEFLLQETWELPALVWIWASWPLLPKFQMGQMSPLPSASSLLSRARKPLPPPGLVLSA